MYGHISSHAFFNTFNIVNATVPNSLLDRCIFVTCGISLASKQALPFGTEVVDSLPNLLTESCSRSNLGGGNSSVCAWAGYTLMGDRNANTDLQYGK